jgi:ubiquinone/menaquinone biosynthesis C-methylase UbiE
MILDAACGAGRYLPYLLEEKRSIIGIDQSQGMLARAKAKFPGVQFEKVGLQEMAYQDTVGELVTRRWQTCQSGPFFVCFSGL